MHPNPYDEASLYCAAFAFPIGDEVEWLLGLFPRARSLLEPMCGNALWHDPGGPRRAVRRARSLPGHARPGRPQAGHGPRYWREADGRVVAQVDHTFEMSLLTWSDLLELSRAAGFEVTHAYAHLSGGRRPRVEPSAALEGAGERNYYFVLRNGDIPHSRPG